VNDDPAPPAPRRVAERALGLSAVVFRAFAENGAAEPGTANRLEQVLAWIADLDLHAELEPWERTFLETPLGRAHRRAIIDGSWLSEGLAVLGWALRRCELPPHDEQVDPQAVTRSLGLLDRDLARRLVEAPRLRSREEPDDLSLKLLVVHGRLRELSLRPGPIDFPDVAANFWLGPVDISALRLIDGDLAIGDLAISDAAPEAVARARSIALERHRAINWLGGYSTIYSEAHADT
jgi:hypothetical protein